MGNDSRIASCSCSAFTVECLGEPVRIGACHCTECQRRTGSVFGVAAYFPRDQVTFSGARKDYARGSDTGRRITNHFCPECGSTVAWDLELFPDLVAVAAGCFADPHLGAPQRGVWAKYKHDWVQFPESIPLLETQPG
jgi:hypothetical protein